MKKKVTNYLKFVTTLDSFAVNDHVVAFINDSGGDDFVAESFLVGISSVGQSWLHWLELCLCWEVHALEAVLRMYQTGEKLTSALQVISMWTSIMFAIFRVAQPNPSFVLSFKQFEKVFLNW